MIEDSIRELARQYDNQFLYSRAKELNNIKLIDNDEDFTLIQILYLKWLEIYNGLYLDLASKEKNIDKDVIEDNILCDAYLYYRSNKKDLEKEEKNLKKRGKAPVDELSKFPSVKFYSGE